MHTLNEIMAHAPTVDNTNGATAASVESGKTFWGLTSGEWGLKTGTASLAGLPKTGQTTSYATGDDGDLEKGVAWPNPRFTDNNGTVTDNLTGLIWLKNANCSDTVGGVTGGSGNSWADALTFANNLAASACGLSDGSTAGNWRLPNLRELQSLIDYGRSNPALPSGHPFTAVQSSNYWSSSTYTVSPSSGWVVYLIDGNVSADDKTSTYYVWPVRGGQ